MEDLYSETRSPHVPPRQDEIQGRPHGGSAVAPVTPDIVLVDFCDWLLDFISFYLVPYILDFVLSAIASSRSFSPFLAMSWEEQTPLLEHGACLHPERI